MLKTKKGGVFMPGRDGTGPAGRGRRFGVCRGGFGNGYGKNWFAVPCKTQKDVLTEQKVCLENRLEIVNKQLENL